MKYFQGPVDCKEIVIKMLKRNLVPGYEARVYTHSRDSGYPGLASRYTFVDIYLEDKQLEDKIAIILEGIGFSER